MKKSGGKTYIRRALLYSRLRDDIQIIVSRVFKSAQMLWIKHHREWGSPAQIIINFQQFHSKLRR